MQFLLMNVILVITSALLMVSIFYYLWNFYKSNLKVKKVNFLLLSITIVSITVALILSVVGVVLASIDAENKVAMYVWIVGTAIILASIVMLFWKIQYFTIGLTSTSISFLGEKILYTNIKTIIDDTNSNRTFIFYSQGKRITKKIALSDWMISSKFFDEKITGIKVESKDAKAYNEELIKNN